MRGKKIFKRIINSLTPRIIFKFSPRRFNQRNYWGEQNFGDEHGYDRYTKERPQTSYLIKEVETKASKHDAILDVGCNCGYYLDALKKKGFTNLSGIDISEPAIKHGKRVFDIDDVSLLIGSFEVILPQLIHQNRKFDLIYSMGATIELVHPSFDIIRNLALLSRNYVILFIQEWGHNTPRLYEYEFLKYDFLMVKCIRPYDGSDMIEANLELIPSLLIFKRIL